MQSEKTKEDEKRRDKLESKEKMKRQQEKTIREQDRETKDKGQARRNTIDKFEKEKKQHTLKCRQNKSQKDLGGKQDEQKLIKIK